MSHFIAESCIIQEATVVKEYNNKAIFRMILQDADNINQNKRLYPKPVLSEAMAQCEERMKRKAFLGELDHPVPKGNDSYDGVRQTTVSLKEVSHYIRAYEWQGTHLMGEIETASTKYGHVLHGLLKDGSGIGMSMRGLAELERLQEYNLVKGPLMIIAFDAVSLPSHKSAVVNFNEMRFESAMLTEQSQNMICLNGQCFLPNYFDKLIETKTIRFFDHWV